MPLHRPHERLVRHVHRLHQSVLTAGHLRKAGGKSFDCLGAVIGLAAGAVGAAAGQHRKDSPKLDEPQMKQTLG